MNRFFPTALLSAALALAIAAGSVPSTAYAYDPDSTSVINVAKDALILQGYDVVAYFTAAKPTQGDAKYSATHDGATYHFASEANLKAFQANPSGYAPQYGGFCAMGAALGKKLDVDPTQFKVVGGKLYLNLNADVFKAWSKNVPENIATGDATWPKIKSKTPASL